MHGPRIMCLTHNTSFSSHSLLSPSLLVDVIQATGKIKQLTVGPMIADAIDSIHNRKSLSEMFK